MRHCRDNRGDRHDDPTGRPHVKLYGKLLLSMVAAGALALAVLALAMNWRLGQGFVDFINAADAERLPAISAALADHYREHGDWHALKRDPRSWREILQRSRELDERSSETGERDRPTSGRRDQRPRDEHESEARANEDRRFRRSGPWAPLWSRLTVYDLDRAAIVGRYPFDESARRLAVETDGQAVGWIGLHEVTEVHSRVAESFLADQRRGLLLASLTMMVILGVSAAILARAWTRPIDRIGRVTRRLAGGDFDARVGSAGKDEIGELARDIDFLAHSLGEADAARKRWMADTAHELRTPLAILKGELEALLDGIRPLDRDAIASLHTETTHLGALIEELRELALADAGALDYCMESLDLADLVRECLDGNAGRIGAHSLHVDAALPTSPVIVQGDSRRLRQLLENLLENTLRYTDAGGRLHVRLVAERYNICLRIEDSAPGVRDDQLSVLFDPFVRGDDARSRASGGSGLGLAICRRIVDAHGGTIGASASALGGLAIDIRLPLLRA
jgi:two-component system sensor histidine kinase BaeS